LWTSDSSQTRKAGESRTAEGNLPCDSQARMVDLPSLVLLEISSNLRKRGASEGLSVFMLHSYKNTANRNSEAYLRYVNATIPKFVELLISFLGKITTKTNQYLKEGFKEDFQNRIK
jgi:hypothetical protein